MSAFLHRHWNVLVGIGIGDSGLGNSGGSNRCHGKVLGLLLDGQRNLRAGEYTTHMVKDLKWQKRITFWYYLPVT